MNVLELRIAGVEDDEQFAAARWELLAFGRISRVDRIGTTDHILIGYQGTKPRMRTWLSALAKASYRAEPIGVTAPRSSESIAY
jgi:hypothetical protein